MDEHNINYYKMDKEKEQRMWKDGILVFDTCALLEFYYFTTKSQEEIFNNVFRHIKGRLWIPGHVEYEYLKNRESTLKKPINEKYEILKKERIELISKGIKDLIKNVDDLANETKKEDSHPYIDLKITNELKELCDSFEKKHSEIGQKMADQIELRKNEILSKVENDNVLKGFNEFFEVGKEYNYTKIMEILIEGEVRYRNFVPPGYLDKGGKNSKEGTQIYGDLIIWKQIIEYAKEVQKPIILISNDTKGDWCDVNNRKRILNPKEDLIREISDEAKVDFWMYTLDQFLYYARTYLGSEINETIIEEVKNIGELKFEFEQVLLGDVFVDNVWENENVLIQSYIEVLSEFDISLDRIQNIIQKINSKGLTVFSTVDVLRIINNGFYETKHKLNIPVGRLLRHYSKQFGIEAIGRMKERDDRGNVTTTNVWQTIN